MIISTFVKELVAGQTVLIKEYQACNWYDRECLLESIEFYTEDDFDYALLELTFPCGMVKKQSWYQVETIKVVTEAP